MVMDEYQEEDPFNPIYQVLFLYFYDKNQICLLLGRREKTKSSEDLNTEGLDNLLDQSKSNTQNEQQ